jgi:hypothetical protein
MTALVECPYRKAPPATLSVNGVDKPNYWKQSYDTDTPTYTYPQYPVDIPYNLLYWNDSCSAVKVFNQSYGDPNYSYLNQNILPGNVAQPGPGCNNWILDGPNCRTCAVVSWNPAMKSACCNAPQEEMTAAQCDPSWCRYSSECILETQQYCSAPLSSTDPTSKRRFEDTTNTPECTYGGRWQMTFPDEWDAMVRPFCSDPNNLTRPVCKQFCGRDDVNCDEVLRAYASNTWAAANTNEKKLAMVSDPLTACWMDTAHNGWYADLYQSQSALVTSLDAMPKDPICVHGPCVASPYKPFASKGSANTCAPVIQCISINQMQNDGQIAGYTSNNNVNCNLNTNPSQCTSNQYIEQQDCTPCPPDQTCAPCVDGKRDACKTCPSGSKPKADRSGCQDGTMANEPSSSSSSGPSGSAGALSFTKMWTRIRTWIKNHPDTSILAGTVVVALILASLLLWKKPNRVGVKPHAVPRVRRPQVVPQRR